MFSDRVMGQFGEPALDGVRSHVELSRSRSSSLLHGSAFANIRNACLVVIGALLLGVVSGGCGGRGSSGTAPGATSIDPPAEPDPPGEFPAFPFESHLSQVAINSGDVRFGELFLIGDELFEAPFNALDGVGALRLPDGGPLPSRFSRVPPGGGRFTGPNGQSCGGCHNSPLPTSAGEASANVHQDPSGLGVPPFNVRNTISLFGAGILQPLAEEMTAELLAIRAAAVAAAVPAGPVVEYELRAKGIDFGLIRVQRDADGVATTDTAEIRGVSPDLVVRPFGWKGDQPSLRLFTLNAANNELGLQADELVLRSAMAGGSDGDDLDGDGVEGELSVGDVTALTVYVAAQEMPTTVDRLAAEGLLSPPPADVARARRRGRDLFTQIGCATCHVPELILETSFFEEPTRRGGDQYFDAELDPAVTRLEVDAPFRFHLVQEGDFPRPQPSADGGLRVPLFGDLKRHRMGRQLADAQPTRVLLANGDALQFGGVTQAVAVDEFLTPELWGVGNSGPWLHDGRAGTLAEAIVLHGEDDPPPVGDDGRSEAQEARDAFVALSQSDQDAVVTFLKGLIHFAFEED